jgi:release factor glutamine methyltransferase
MDTIPDHELERLKRVAGSHGSLDELISRRKGGEPLQYIEGNTQFVSLDLLVDSRVLVPRPETESLFELACRMVRVPEIVVDLCTGSGALALALKKQFPGASVFATDVSPEAIEVATANMYRTGQSIYLAEGDLFDPLPASLLGEVDLIVANPPYVAESDYPSLPEDVRREPKVALVAGSSGLEVIQAIGASAARWLRPGGVVVCEIGETQGVAAVSSFHEIPMVVRQDLSGKDRFVVGARP